MASLVSKPNFPVPYQFLTRHTSYQITMNKLSSQKENINAPKAASLIKNAKNILIVIHQNPDADAVSSASGLFLALDGGKKIDSVCVDKIPSKYLFLKQASEITKTPKQDFAKYNLIVTLDCGSLSQTGFEEELEPYTNCILNIDHHVTNPGFGQWNLVDTASASTTEIVYLLIKALGAKITQDIATALLTGLYFDTGFFMHPNTTERNLKIAADLIKKGARVSKIMPALHFQTIASLKLWGKALERIRKSKNGIVISVIKKEDLKDVDAKPEDLEGVVNLINTIPGVKATLLLSEKGDELKGSFRTLGDVDVSKLAVIMGGGGHKKAAGFSVKAEITDSEEGWGVK